MTRPLEYLSYRCPWCGEANETAVDMVSGEREWVEDCAVCCAPIVFRRVDSVFGEEPEIAVWREGE
jgi:hypothetical protein